MWGSRLQPPWVTTTLFSLIPPHLPSSTPAPFSLLFLSARMGEATLSSFTGHPHTSRADCAGIPQELIPGAWLLVGSSLLPRQGHKARTSAKIEQLDDSSLGVGGSEKLCLTLPRAGRREELLGDRQWQARCLEAAGPGCSPPTAYPRLRVLGTAGRVQSG